MAISLLQLVLLVSTASRLSARVLYSKSFGSRIVNGREIDISLVPWQVALLYKNLFHCGGSVYSPDIIITAAHCVADRNVSDFLVRAASSNVNFGGQLRNVDSIWSHEGFSWYTAANDIAVLRLSEPLTLGTLVQPIVLATSSPQNNDRAYVSGWGFTGYEYPEYLYGVELEIMDHEQCRQTAYGELILEDMFCAFEENRDACDGDSGGPLVSNGELVGIVSWGYACAVPEFPGVYASVSYFQDWLLNTIEASNKAFSKGMNP